MMGRNVSRPTPDVWYQGPRVQVRRLALEDIGSGYVSWFEDGAVRQFIKYAREAPGLADLHVYWRSKDADAGVDFLGIFDAATGLHIGNVKFETGPAADEMHVGFLIGHPESRRRGLLRECLAACIGEVRRRRGPKRIYLTVDPQNEAAQGAFLRLGFRPTGRTDAVGDLEMDYRDG